MSLKLPRRVVVQSVISSRYLPGSRPENWDERCADQERVISTGGEEILLCSAGGQSSPAPGWELLLTTEVPVSKSTAYEWTLYGIRPYTRHGHNLSMLEKKT